ncbi:MAG: SDR family oxidoreductase [Ilumatobacteraceae bacterium]
MSSYQLSFAGEVAFVTGASGGMGKAISLGFAAAGASVVLADVDDSNGEAVAAACRSHGVDAVFVHCDVSDPDSVAAAFALVAERHGRLDCAVNAAAIENEEGPLHECPLDRFDQMQAINLRGTFLCMKHEIEMMLPAGKGSIVVIASTNSFRPQASQPAYTASKHGVLGLVRSAAYDYAARGIRVNAICPGSIDTPMLRNAMERRGRDPQEVASRLSALGRFGTPEEIADATLWLCSDASSFTLGHALAVDAGYLAR